MLNFKILYSGFDYEYLIECSLEPKVGEYLISDANIIKGKDNWVLKYPLITITSVENDKINFVVPSEYVEGNSSVLDSISVGEKKEYSYSHDTVATIYDEDYDYTIERRLEIKMVDD